MRLPNEINFKLFSSRIRQEVFFIFFKNTTQWRLTNKMNADHSLDSAWQSNLRLEIDRRLHFAPLLLAHSLSQNLDETRMLKVENKESTY